MTDAPQERLSREGGGLDDAASDQWSSWGSVSSVGCWDQAANSSLGLDSLIFRPAGHKSWQGPRSQVTASDQGVSAGCLPPPPDGRGFRGRIGHSNDCSHNAIARRTCSLSDNPLRALMAFSRSAAPASIKKLCRSFFMTWVPFLPAPGSVTANQERAQADSASLGLDSFIFRSAGHIAFAGCSSRIRACQADA